MDWLLQMVGWGWIVLGVWGIVRPDSARKRVERAVRRKLRWVAMFLLTAVGGSLCVEAFRVAGWIGGVLGVAGAFLLFNGLALLRTRTTDWMAAWWSSRPIWVYRLVSALSIFAGAGLQWWTRVEPASRGG